MGSHTVTRQATWPAPSPLLDTLQYFTHLSWSAWHNTWAAPATLSGGLWKLQPGDKPRWEMAKKPAMVMLFSDDVIQSSARAVKHEGYRIFAYHSDCRCSHYPSEGDSLFIKGQGPHSWIMIASSLDHVISHSTIFHFSICYFVFPNSPFYQILAAFSTPELIFLPNCRRMHLTLLPDSVTDRAGFTLLHTISSCFIKALNLPPRR